MSVHPDHAALIADLRENARALGFSLVLSANFIESQVDLNDRAADALASASSPRTPPPQRASAEEIIANLERMAASKHADQQGHILVRRMISYLTLALAAAPKVEQRTPTLAEFRAIIERNLGVADGRTGAHHEGGRAALQAVMRDLAAFTSPEAPESAE